MSPPKQQPEIINVTFNKVSGSMGLSIVAAKVGATCSSGGMGFIILMFSNYGTSSVNILSLLGQNRSTLEKEVSLEEVDPPPK